MAITQLTPDEGPLTALVARRVRGLLGELDLDRQALGPILGVSGSSASKRVRGDMPFALDELPVLADALGTTVAYLLGLTDTRRAPSINVDEAPGVVRHEGLEPPTRWFAVTTTPLNAVPGGIQEPARALAPVATEEPLEQLATVLPFHRPARGRLLGGARPVRPRPSTEQAS